MSCRLAGKALPTSDDGVDIAGVELQSIAVAAGPLSREYGGATAKKTVQHNFSSAATVQDSVSHQRDRLRGRMQREKITFLFAA